MDTLCWQHTVKARATTIASISFEYFPGPWDCYGRVSRSRHVALARIPVFFISVTEVSYVKLGDLTNVFVFTACVRVRTDTKECSAKRKCSAASEQVRV